MIGPTRTDSLRPRRSAYNRACRSDTMGQLSNGLWAENLDDRLDRPYFEREMSTVAQKRIDLLSNRIENPARRDFPSLSAPRENGFS